MKYIKMNDDDDRAYIIESVWEKVKDEISREEYDRITERASKRKVIDLAAYLMKCVQTHIASQATAAAAEQDKPQRRRSKRDLPVVDNDSIPARELTPEEEARMYELARKLKERK